MSPIASPLVPRIDRLHLIAVVACCTAIQIWIAASRYETATWIGTEPLPTFLAGDGAFYRATLLSIIDDGDIDVRNQFDQLHYDPATRASIAADGRWVPKHPIVMPLLSIPFFAIAGDTGLLAFNLLQLALLTSIMWLLARGGATPVAASIATIIFTIGTMLRPAAYNWSPDVLATLLTMAALLALFRHRTSTSAILIALSVWAKITNLMVVPLLAIYAVWTSTRAEWQRFVGVTAIGLGTIALWQWQLFGSPLVTPYDRVIESVANGIATIEPSHRTFFDVNIFQGVWAQLTDRRMGLLASAPPLAAAALGLLPLYRRQAAMTTLIVSVMAAQILTFGSYRLWEESNFGHRFLLTVVALGAIPFAALIDSLRPTAEPSRE